MVRAREKREKRRRKRGKEGRRRSGGVVHYGPDQPVGPALINHLPKSSGVSEQASKQVSEVSKQVNE